MRIPETEAVETAEWVQFGRFERQAEHCMATHQSREWVMGQMGHENRMGHMGHGSLGVDPWPNSFLTLWLGLYTVAMIIYRVSLWCMCNCACDWLQRALCDLKTHVQNLGYSLPLPEIVAQKPPLWTTSQLNATLTAYIFGTKHDIDKWSDALTTTRCLLHRPKMSWILVHFTHPLCKFCFLRYCQASHTEISKQKSTTVCQTANGQSR